MTHVLYFKEQANRAEQRTMTNNKPIQVVFSKKNNEQVKVHYSLISHMIQKEVHSPSAIRFALAIYAPINELEYE
jgi:type I site-specific restriction endonuclease